jgi:hypothetical protein
MNFPFQRLQQATNIFGGLSSGTPSTPGMPYTTSPYLAGAEGIASLGNIGGPISNVIGDVVKGAGNILGDIFRRQDPVDVYETREGGSYDVFGGPSGPSIYETGDYIF